MREQVLHPTTAATDRLAERVLDIVPLIMKWVHRDLRCAQSIVEPNHVRILMRLRHGPHNVSNLAEAEKVTLPSMSNTVDVLVKRGWVERVPDSSDRRVIHIRLTDEGVLALQEMRRVMIQKIGQMLSTLNERDVEALAEGLDVLYKAFTSPSDRLESEH